MRATKFEYRFRFILHGLIFALGFYAPSIFGTLLLVPSLDRNSVAGKTAWLTLASFFATHHWLPFTAATDVVLALALIFAVLGALFRVWGSAFVGSTIVASPDMHSHSMLADGPYRHTRNPLYLGTLLHTIGLSILMPAIGAIVAIALIWVLQVRLALAEEPFLAARFGQPYLDYKARVPRFLPTLAPLVPAAGQQPRWLQAFAGELYFVAVVFIMAIWGWQFNAHPLLVGIVISLAVWLVARCLIVGAFVDAAILSASELLFLFGWLKDNQTATRAAIIALGVLLIVKGVRRPANPGDRTSSMETP
jgi:protein-S-isoprenylcysteine O-methyltransferase Ste14